MGSHKQSEKYIRFIIYCVVIILINVVGYSLFFRADLTANNIYSVSDATKNTISDISEPLTIKVFFTENLPAPHNTTRKYIQDLLEEYALHSNDNFNYTFYDIKSGDEKTEDSEQNSKLAESYGIRPIQIMVLEQDERKYQLAYMGIVIIHGDMIEKLPAVTTTQGFEYKLTMAVKKLKNKTSALLALPEKVKVDLYYSPSLETVAPYMGLNNLSGLPDQIEKTVQKINAMNYGKIDYSLHSIDSQETLKKVTDAFNIVSLQWPEIDNKKGAPIPAGSGGIGMVLQYGSNVSTIKILNTYNIPIIGTKYELTPPDALEEIINGRIESLIDINEKVGYLTSHGTLTRQAGQNPMMQQQDQGLTSFNTLMAEGYSLKDIDLKKDTIPAGINSLIIANPTEKFNDYELYQIDQALMTGKNIVFFLDPFKEVQPKQQMSFNRGPSYEPVDSGLEKLMTHYGIRYQDAYVLDKNCYKQNMSRQSGGGERLIYFAPMIENRNINNTPPFMKNIKGLVTMKAAPLSVTMSELEKNNITATRLFSTSEDAWLMKGRINLNPAFIRPPSGADKFDSYPLAYMLEGEFTSYFDGKAIPAKPTTLDEKTDDANPESPTPPEKDLSVIKKDGDFIAKSSPGRIIVVGSAEMLKDTMLDAEGASPNAVFIMNTIDKINDREDIALMRSKEQKFNPLDDIAGADKMTIKLANIAGLPALVILIGIIVWAARNKRKKRIQMLFSE